MASAGCELGNTLGDVAGQLADPELESVETGGRQIAAGTYRDVRFDGTAADGAFVVALRDGNQLSITPFNGGKGCEPGPARAYRNALLRTEDDSKKLDARIAFQTPQTEEDPGELRFTNFACEVDEVTVPGGSLPIAVRFSADPGFIVQDLEESLFYVNPWRNELKLLAEDAIRIDDKRRAIFAPGAGGAEKMWAIAGGELIVRDNQLRLEHTLGKDLVKEDLVALAHSSSGAGGPMVALLNEAGDLYTALASDLDAVKRIDTNACEMGFNVGLNGRELIYYSPCEDRHLISYELDTDTRRDLGKGVQRYRITGMTESGPLVLYVTDVDEFLPEVGTLWVRWGDNAPIRIGERGNLALSLVTVEQDMQVVLNWSDKGGDLYVGKLGDEDMDPVATEVAYMSPLGIVSEFDGANGKLQKLDAEDGSLELLAKSASIYGVKVDSLTQRGLFLSDFDGQEGALTLLDGTKTRLISENVRPGQYQFTALLPMVTVLSDLEAGTATLKLRHLERDEEVIVSTGVAEAVEVGWPREGMLYSVPEGERAGVWFAGAF